MRTPAGSCFICRQTIHPDEPSQLVGKYLYPAHDECVRLAELELELKGLK